MKRRVLSASLLVVVGMLACSSGPSTSRSEQSLRERINKESEGKITLVSFSKTNGQETALMGVPSYRLDYEAVIEFGVDCRWGSGGPGGWQGDFHVYVPVKESPAVEMLSMPMFTAKKGSRTTVKGRLDFEKTEAGWRGGDGEIY